MTFIVQPEEGGWTSALPSIEGVIRLLISLIGKGDKAVDIS